VYGSVIIIVPLSHYVGSAQHVFFFHSLLSLVICMLTSLISCHPSHSPSIFSSLGTLVDRPLLGCPSTFILITLFVMWLPFLRMWCMKSKNPFFFFCGCRKTGLKINSVYTQDRLQWAYHISSLQISNFHSQMVIIGKMSMSQRNFWDALSTPTRIKREWYVSRYGNMFIN
jgi:hypothetical protein